MTSEISADDVLYGVPAIAAAFRLKDRQVYHLKAEHGLPTYKVGRTVCARRGAVAEWFAEREAAARPDAEKSRQEPQDGREAGKGSPAAPDPSAPASGRNSRSGGRRG